MASPEYLPLSFVANSEDEAADTILNNGGTLTSGATSCTVDTLPTGVSNLITLYGTAIQFRMRIQDEIMLVTSVGGTGNKTWQLTRGVEGTSAASHATDSKVYIGLITPAGLAQWLKDHSIGAKLALAARCY